MRGYPKNSMALTKRDFENLLSIPEYRERAKADLAKLAAIDDAKVTIDVSTGRLEKSDPNGEFDLVAVKLEKIDNPMPAWKRAGFASKDDLSKLILRK